jgi:hypothetical protein
LAEITEEDEEELDEGGGIEEEDSCSGGEGVRARTLQRSDLSMLVMLQLLLQARKNYNLLQDGKQNEILIL